jgi:two-component system LytT family response regulator
MTNSRVIIIEDEIGAANNLTLLLREIAPNIRLLNVLTSIQQSVEWLAQNQHPDLAFFDIQLEDGLSFEIFKQLNLNFPVIFTTAFNEYAIEAFKVNSVDYLLKPVKEEDLRFSLQKYKSLHTGNITQELITKIYSSLPRYREPVTFLIRYRDKLIPIPEKDFAFFYTENGLVRGCTYSNHVYPIDHTVEDLEVKLTSAEFFKANRQYIVSRRAVQEIEFYFNSRLLLKLSPAAKDTVLVSKARVPLFKEWMKGEISPF